MDWIYIQSMDILKRIQLEKRRDDLLAELRALGNLMRGSLVQTKVKCGRKGCICESGEKHVKVHLSVNLHGRTRGCYVGQGREEAISVLLGEYQRAWKIIEDLTEVNLELLRGEHAGGRRRKRA
jgi:hypothetical protein